jgi:DNA segregation ATPase FtsK/SpoIIIE-like protein
VRLALDVADATDAALSQVPATTPALPDADDLYARAVALVRDTKQPSTSMLQRRLGIGWDEASDLIERMTAEKVLPLEKIKADGKRKAVAA